MRSVRKQLPSWEVRVSLNRTIVGVIELLWVPGGSQFGFHDGPQYDMVDVNTPVSLTITTHSIGSNTSTVLSISEWLYSNKY